MAMLTKALPLDMTLLRPPMGTSSKPFGDLFEMFIGALARQPHGYAAAKWLIFLTFCNLADVAQIGIRQFRLKSG